MPSLAVATEQTTLLPECGVSAPETRRSEPHLNPVLKLVLDSFLLACFLAGVLALCNKAAASMDEDLWWHLRTGNWIVQHHAVPWRDTFAAPTNGQTWIAYTWLFDVLISRIYNSWHLPGVLSFTACLILAAVSGLVALLSRYTDLHRAVGLGMAALFGIGTLASPRPWLFTVPFFILELYLLVKARESGRAVWLWSIVPLLALWANIHIQFVYGLGIIALFALEAPLASFLKLDNSAVRLASRWFWILLALSGLATLANPYGWKLYSVVLQYARQSVPLTFIQEMQPLQFRGLTDWVPLVLTGLAVFALAKLKAKHPILLLLLVAACWFGFRSARDVWFLVVIATLILAQSWLAPRNRASRFGWAPWAIALPLVLAVGSALLHDGKNSDRALGEAVAKRFPQRAAAYIEAHALPGPLFNTFDWGGYLIWRLPNRPVSIDGRANLYGDANLQRFAATWFGKSDWAADPQLKKARIILLDRDCPLASILRSDQRYRLLYQDDLASVLQPVQPENASTGR